MADADATATAATLARPTHEPRRACQECNRKKTKCDMMRPVCGLCSRTGNVCHFPSKRKKPTVRKPPFKLSSRKISDSLSKLVQALEAATHADPADADARPDVPQDVLRDSLKDLLAEMNPSGAGRAASPDHAHRPRHHRHRAPGGSEADGDGDGDDSDDDDGDDSDSDSDGRDHDRDHDRDPDPDQARRRRRETTDTSDARPRPRDHSEAPCAVALDLVDHFFDKIQPWLPLLHRPRFQARYEKQILVEGDVIKALPADDALLFYSMFALSARFSHHPQFAAVPVERRGLAFAERAKRVYTQSRDQRAPSLVFLQGCILLAFYFYTSGPTPQGWILIGVCVRMAYELGLSDLDDDAATPATPLLDPVDKEEMRRAWWCLWELDTFASSVTRHPYSIDRKRMAVKLPVSDAAWFAEIDVPSAELTSLPGQSWRALQDCPNQDERAWFLVANNLMATVNDRLQQKTDVTADEKRTLENEICCFKLALPPTLHLAPENVTFTPTTFPRCNWVIGIHLMLMAISYMVNTIAPADLDDRSVSSATASTTVLPLRHRAVDLSRILNLWDARFIALSSPFYACMMLPPAATCTDLLQTHPLIASTHDLSKLVLGYFNEKWKLGSVVSEVVKIVERGGPVDKDERQLVKNYALFFRLPRMTGASPASAPSEVTRKDPYGPSVGDAGGPYPGQLDLQPPRSAPRQPQQHVPPHPHPQPPPAAPPPVSRIPPHPDFPAPMPLTNQPAMAVFPLPMYDVQNFPPLQAHVYDGSAELDFGFADFFGAGYNSDFMLT